MIPWKRYSRFSSSAKVSVELDRRFLADDPHALGVVALFEEPVVAVDDLFERGHLFPLGGPVEALEDLVDALAHEGLDALGVRRNLEHVAVLEALRTILEGRETRVAVDLRHPITPRGARRAPVLRVVLAPSRSRAARFRT